LDKKRKDSREVENLEPIKVKLQNSYLTYTLWEGL